MTLLDLENFLSIVNCNILETMGIVECNISNLKLHGNEQFCTSDGVNISYHMNDAYINEYINIVQRVYELYKQYNPHGPRPKLQVGSPTDPYTQTFENPKTDLRIPFVNIQCNYIEEVMDRGVRDYIELIMNNAHLLVKYAIIFDALVYNFTSYNSSDDSLEKSVKILRSFDTRFQEIQTDPFKEYIDNELLTTIEALVMRANQCEHAVDICDGVIKIDDGVITLFDNLLYCSMDNIDHILDVMVEYGGFTFEHIKTDLEMGILYAE